MIKSYYLQKSVCAYCKEPVRQRLRYTYDPATLRWHSAHGCDVQEIHELSECPFCGYTGFKIDFPMHNLSREDIEEINREFDTKYRREHMSHEERKHLKQYLTYKKVYGTDEPRTLDRLAKALYQLKGREDIDLIIMELEGVLDRTPERDSAHLAPYLDLLRELGQFTYVKETIEKLPERDDYLKDIYRLCLREDDAILLYPPDDDVEECTLD